MSGVANYFGVSSPVWSKFVSGGCTALSAYGAAREGMDASDAMKYNSGIYAEEARTAAAQGYEQEAQTRRQTAGELGREEAAAGEAGAGYGGSTGRMIGQSALNAELDALNVRYKSQLQKWAYNAQSANLANEAGTVRTGGFLKAGAALLRGNRTCPGPKPA